jgi:hypothetical protein
VHAEIEGFMQTMTVGYMLTRGSVLKAVKPGDRVRIVLTMARRRATVAGGRPAPVRVVS